MTKAGARPRRPRRAVLQHHERLGLDQAVGVGRADHRRFEDGRMLHQRRLDLERAHPDAARPSACRRYGRRRCNEPSALRMYLSPLLVQPPWKVSRVFARAPQYISAADGPWM